MEQEITFTELLDHLPYKVKKETIYKWRCQGNWEENRKGNWEENAGTHPGDY